MNIPEEVIEQAYRAFLATPSSVYPDKDKTRARAEYAVIAEWARVEALREIEEALDSLDGSRATGYYASEAHSGYQEAQRDMEMALERIRALPEGTPERGN